ncbi:S41 family peptidase [Muricauda sp. 334s03]|uniref:S41 family peptidase n=1 Tax=Flagellimonas yonaguniensis TaxID=3031325 RepID=A0ABT5Y0J7_9FLAO|nr:S41 family peptidase [[Muricauda] yonaguniensis]MDF0716920.1 S41 family peptidase [[Muricauda] yonaguniensis]
MVLIFLGCCEQEDRKIKNLTTFSKLYGYVKYFHPSDEAHEMDWDKFAMYGAGKVVDCKTDDELVLTLKELFEPIAPTVRIYGEKDKQKDFDNAVLTPKNDSGNYDLIYWQHKGLGYGMANKRGIYKSVRVNRSEKIDVSAQMGNLINALDGKKYQNKKIKYSAWVKLSKDSEGTGHLWIREDKTDGGMGFFQNMMEEPILPKDGWQQYELSGEASSITDKIFFGFFLNGKGRMWVDDVKLSYEDNGEWIDIPFENSDFEEQGDEDGVAKWKAVGKGYRFDMDKDDHVQGEQSLEVTYYGKFENTTGDKLFDYDRNIGAVYKDELAPNIFCRIPLALYANEKGTFPVSNSEDLRVLRKSISDLELSPDDLAFRLGNIINVYNVFQHFYPYYDVVGTNWNQDLNSALNRSYQDSTLQDHLVTLQKFTAKLKDGHVRVSASNNQKYSPPISWEWIGDKLVVTEVYATVPLKVGDVITHINGLSSKTYFDEVESRISAGTKGWLDYRAKTESLKGVKDSELVVKVNNKEVTLVRDHDLRSKGTKGKIKDRYKIYDDGVVYINLDVIEMDTINQLMPQLENSKAIICDLRGYPKGNHDFISHLLKSKDTTMGWMSVPRIVAPNRENLDEFEQFQWNMPTMEPYLGDKNVIFITDGRAISYAESYMGYIEGYDLATIIGQPTAGTNGNINYFDLPGKIRIVWTGMKVVKHDGTQHHAIGVLPDIYLTKTIEGVKQGKDEFLEKALKLARNN